MTDPRQKAIREGLIARAVRLRQIAPDRADDYRRLYDADPMGITRLLTAPVSEGGLMAGVAAAEAPFEPAPTEYPREWLHDGSRPTGRVSFEDVGTAADALASAQPTPRQTPAPPAGRPSRVTIEP